MKTLTKLSLMATFILVFGMASAATQAFAASLDEPTRSNHWLPFAHAELDELYARELDAENTEWVSLAQRFERARVAAQGKPRKLEKLETRVARLAEVLDPRDEIQFLLSPDFSLAILVAGEGDKIHTVRMMVPLVNYTRDDQERAFAFLEQLHVRAFSSKWDGAKDWPKTSLATAWNLVATEMGKGEGETRRPRNEMLITHTSDHVTAVTFGVPPDLVVYTITTRERCVPDLEVEERTFGLGFICAPFE
jgi:hypothetical protein